jgi:ribonuclease HII
MTEEVALQQGGFFVIAGVDEAGRGAWAGPLVAGAVILTDGSLASADPADVSWAGVRDSKMMTHEQRDAIYETILVKALAVGVGAVAPDEIDLLGLTAANELAMARAIRALPVRPEALLVDAFVLPSVAFPQRALIKGDARSLSIAAASIVAKVSRDRWMESLAEQYPGYGFEQHRGYGVAIHQEALARLGPSPIHRLSYAPLRALTGA